MNHKTKAELIAFEARVRDEFAAGKLPFLIHLSGGNEDQLIDLFGEARPGDWFFSTHRSHYHYLLAGGAEEKLMGMIRAGRSMFVFDRARNFFTSSILGGCCAIAAGVAWAIAQDFHAEGSQSPANDPDACPLVWCFVGDGAEENGHFYEAVLFVHAHHLPCRFIIEDNGFSVDTPIADRTKGMRIAWPPCVRRIRYDRTYPHAGPGLDQRVTFDPAIVSQYSRCGASN